MLLDLAEHKSEGRVTLNDIAQRQGISRKYLEQIILLLNKSGMLRTTRGYQGGYALAKEPDQYTVGQILRITEGKLCPVACMKDEPNQCERNRFCKTLPVWQGLESVLNTYLDGITLQTILDDDNARDGLTR